MILVSPAVSLARQPEMVTEPAKVLVVVVNEAGKPLTVPEKP